MEGEHWHCCFGLTEQAVTDSDKVNCDAKRTVVRRCHMVSYTIFIFYLFFCFWLPSRLCDASASILCSLSYNPQPSSLYPSILPSSVFCSSSVLCHFVTPSPLFMSSVFCLSYYLFHLLSSDSLPLCSVSIFIISTSVHYSLSPHSDFDSLPFRPLWLCKSISTFSILLQALYYISLSDM